LGRTVTSAEAARLNSLVRAAKRKLQAEGAR
jgi:hypothetical protein